jgi:hypothetical protein
VHEVAGSSRTWADLSVPSLGVARNIGALAAHPRCLNQRNRAARIGHAASNPLTSRAGPQNHHVEPVHQAELPGMTSTMITMSTIVPMPMYMA